MQRLIITFGMLLAAPTAIAQHGTILIQGVHSGTAQLRQFGRLTVLDFTPKGGAKKRIALTHPTDYRRGTNAPYDSTVIAENPGRFLIFVDSYASNPGNIQGQCGADPDGERFVHVVALGMVPHETLSVLFDSCLLDIEARADTPKWLPKRDSAGFVGQLILCTETDPNHKIVYWVDSDGAVTRPSMEAIDK